MEVSMLQLPPGDPGLIDKIVCQLKSNGIFDQFRKECIADVDTKPAYQNLRQRVEGSVSSFLTNQEWRADLNKNQLRDSLRKQIHESGFLDIGVERIVDQVVNPKIYTVFFPKVEDVVYGFLGLEKPKKGADIQNGLQPNILKFEENIKPEKKFVSLKDLLPTDLDPISPEKLDSDEDIEENSTDKIKVNDSNEVDQPSCPKVKVKEEINSDLEHEYDEDEKEDEEDDDDEASPPFESLEADALDANALPPVIPLHSADMLDNITSSSSSSETKDLLQYGEVRKRYPDPKLDSIKKEVDVEGEKRMPPEQVKTETITETIKKEEKEKKEVVEPRKDSKKLEKKEEKSRDNGERKDEARSRKSVSDSRDGRDKHVHDKKRNDRDQVSIKQERDDSKRSDKEEQRKILKEEHKKSEKDDHRKSEKDEAKKSEKDELRKSEKVDKKHGEKDDSRKVDKERDSSRRHDRDKDEKKSLKDREEKHSDKDKKHVREKEEVKRSEKDEHRKSDKERDESRRSDKERSESKKRDKKDEKKPEKEKEEKKPEKEKEEKKVVKEKDDSKKGDKEEARKSEKEEGRKSEKEKDRHRGGKEKLEHTKGEKDVKERVKPDHKEKDVKYGSSKSGVETSKKDSNEKDHQSKVTVDKKKEDGMKKPHHRDSSKTSSNKDKKVGEKEKKVSSTDDHKHERDKGKNGHRRSDRDKDRERERSQAEGATQAALGKDGGGQSSSTSSTPSSSSEGSKGGGDSSSGGGGGSERAKEEEHKVKAGSVKEVKHVQKGSNLSDVYSSLNSSGNLVLKIKKPKIAANIYEVKKIMQVRKNLKKLERERLASANASKVSHQKANEIVAESASKLEELSETKPAPVPPKVKRAKLGAVEQDLRGEVESVLEKSLLEGEDGEIGEVHYLEDNPNLPDFVLYVRSLTEAAAAGDYSRVPSPTHSIATIELSDYEDNVILSDIELSKEDEDTVTKLGGHVERKSDKPKSPKKSSPTILSSDLIGEGSNKRPRRPNPRYNSGEYTVYSDEDEDDMTDSVSQKKVAVVDGVGPDRWKTPKERSLEADEEVDAIGHHESSGTAAIPTPENDAGCEDRETPVLSKRNQAAAEERRRLGRRLGVRGPLRRVAGISPGTPDTFVMPLSPESDVSTASGDAGKKASLNTKALENQYNQGDMDGELGPEDYEDARGSEDGDTKQSRLPLGPPLSSAHKSCDIKRHAGYQNQNHDEIGHPSSGLTDGDRRIDDPPGLGPRRLRGTRSSSRVQQRYSSDDLYKPRPNITLGRRNRGRNSPTQDESPTPESALSYAKQGRRGSAQGSDEVLVEGCMPNKRRRR